MDYTGRTQWSLMFVCPADLEAEADRLFASHAEWMQRTHHREGDKALLQYTITKGPGDDGAVVGEHRVLCALSGGIYLSIRKAAAWQLPAGAIVGLVVFSAITQVLQLTPFTVLQHLLSGAFLFGAFFIATDPVTNPMARMGRFYYGIGYGALVVLLRVFSGYPEGVMFAVLIMNAATPLINRFTVPTPVGGPVPQQA